MTSPAWAAAIGQSGSHRIALKLGNREYIAGFDVYDELLEARISDGLPAITDYASNFALWELPLNGWVELSQLPPEHADCIRALPAGFVEFRGEAVQRRTRPPVVVRFLVAERTTASTALGAFGTTWWAPLEVAVSSRGASARTEAHAQALGIGLFARGEWRAFPRPKQPARPTPLLWWQAELTYAAWISQRDRATA